MMMYFTLFIADFLIYWNLLDTADIKDSLIQSSCNHIFSLGHYEVSDNIVYQRKLSHTDMFSLTYMK